MGRVYAWTFKHPVLAIMLVSLLAVIINCYPVIFCGKSYVSPASVDALVYAKGLVLPGTTVASQVIQHGTDTGAIMWWGVPVGFIESRSLWEHGELPLWNRYSHAGDTLVGQAISMLGDPLQWIVIMGHGSAVAWDIKFLTAKFLFCCGFGLLVLRILGGLPLSLLYSALAAYCGAFFPINNHPVFFVLAYTPWVLMSAMAWLDLRSTRRVYWGGLWLLANFACFNAGHVEPAVVLIAGLNAVALVHGLTACRHIAEVLALLARMMVGTILFLGLTAPMWLSFLVALQGSYSMHANIQIMQLPVACLPGVFDDLFYQMKLHGSFGVSVPGTSLLVLAGCVFSIWLRRSWRTEPFFWINSGAIVLWSGCIFGWVPSFVLASIPMLNRVGHTYTDFSYLLIIHLTIQSAYGLKWLAQEAVSRRVIAGFVLLAGILGGLNWLVSNQSQPVERYYFLCAAAGAIGAPLLFVFLKNRHRQVSAFGWIGILILGFVPNHRFGLYEAGNDYLLMVPGQRAVLNAPSQAVDNIKADQAAPFRVVGLAWNFAGDYAAVYGLEDIRSCAPLSNGELINLLQNYPGMKFNGAWAIEPTNPVLARPLLNLLNVKYLLAQPDAGFQGGAGFRLVERSDFQVFLNPNVWPRAFFTDKVVSIDSNDEFIQYLSANGDRPFAALTKGEIAKQPEILNLEGKNPTVVHAATSYRLRPNSTAFDIHAPSAGMVCLTEGQAKDFIATANNETKPVLTVNRAFKGIYLDRPGDYHIQFTYRPRYWRLACFCFWSSVCLVIVLVIAGGIYARRRKNQAQLFTGDHE